MIMDEKTKRFKVVETRSNGIVIVDKTKTETTEQEILKIPRKAKKAIDLEKQLVFIRSVCDLMNENIKKLAL